MTNDQVQTFEIEKVVAGGFGLARHDGRVVLVRGAIPGEVVRARVQRTGKGGVLFADVVDVLEPSADRVEPATDPRCGGLAFAHVRYARQLNLKADLLRDALRRTGRVPEPPPFEVMASPLEGWRLRARLHVVDGQVGFFREGTHSLCPPPASQLPAHMREAAQAVVEVIPAAVQPSIAGVVVAEDVASTSRAVHVDLREQARIPQWQADLPLGVAGLSVARSGRRDLGQVLGHPLLHEPLAALCGQAVDGTLVWQPGGFFQANRFVLPHLVQAVLAQLDESPVVDLFAGVGLFGVCAAATGQAAVCCVEGDGISGEALQINAAPFGGRVDVLRQPVETFVSERRLHLDAAVVVVDPPRTGLPPRVAAALCEASPARVVYVSCDPPTFARDVRQLTAAGYALRSLAAFDMFPGTAHLETLAVLERPSS